jgi:hypothetical protein
MSNLLKVFFGLFKRKKGVDFQFNSIQTPISNCIFQASTSNHFRTNWQEYQKTLNDNGIEKLYHFTDIANLDSIRKHEGLYSWHYSQKNNIKIDRPGGNQLSRNLDTAKGLQNYVRTSFVKHHPMMYSAQKEGRILNPIILEIDPEIMFFDNTLFAPKNAAKNGTIASGSIEMLKSINFEILKRNYFDLDSAQKPYYQAEVLTLQSIPIKYILNINNL